MSLRFQSALMIDNLPDEQIDNQWEVIMPTLNLKSENTSSGGGFIKSAINGLKNMLNSYQPIVEQITFGNRNFKTDTRRVRTGWCNVPSDILNYEDVQITMFCSSGMLTQYYIDAWKRLVFNEDGEYYNPMQDYKKNIEVYFFGPGNVGAVVPPVGHWTLKGCFPYMQDKYKLQYSGNPKRLTLTVNFKVDKIVPDESLKTSSIIQELVTSPTSLLDKAITTLSSGPSDYSVSNIYGYDNMSTGKKTIGGGSADITSDDWMDDSVINV